MKKLMAVLLTLAMVSSLFCGMTVFAAAEEVTVTAAKDWDSATYDAETGVLTNGTYSFTVALASSTMTISAFAGAADITEVYIPQLVYGGTTYKTVVLDANVFVGYPTISKIVAVDALNINASAFDPAATTLDITAGTKITPASAAFAECTAIKNITLTAPTSITLNPYKVAYAAETLEKFSYNSAKFVINGGAFNSCASFDKLYFNDVAFGEKLESGNFKIKVRKDMDFNKSRKDPFSGAKVEHLTFEEGITMLAETQFRNCGAIKYIDFPKSLTKIDNNAFNACGGVISLDSSVPDDAEVKVWNLPNITSVGTCGMNFNNLGGELVIGVKSLGQQAFRGVNCTKITFVNPVTSFNANGFYEMYDLKTAVFEQGVSAFPTSDLGRVTASNNIVFVYPDTAIESHKDLAYPSNVAATMPFGAYVHTFAEGAEGGYDVTYAVANYKEKSIGKALVALYDAQGAMIGAKTVDATVGTTLTTVNVPANGIVASAKIFVLNNLSDLTPQYVNYEYVPVVEEPAA